MEISLLQNFMMRVVTLKLLLKILLHLVSLEGFSLMELLFFWELIEKYIPRMFAVELSIQRHKSNKRS
jgi:hypothetical protein